MHEEGRRRLKLVTSMDEAQTADADGAPDASVRDTDWSILMARAQDGDNTAYLRLLEEIAPYLRALVRRWHRDPWDIEDTVQDILLTLHSIRQTYDPARPFGPWLVGIAHRRAIDRLRRHGRQRSRETPLDPAHEVAAAPDMPGDVMGERRLKEALGTLPPVQQQAIDLLKMQEMSLKEASDATGLSVASLKMATHRALRNLRGLLSDRRDS